MKLITGLGNPGFRYRATRHNIGFMVIDKIAVKSRIRLKRRGFNSLFGAGMISNQEVMLVKPLTYMNLSGKAILELKRKEKVALEDLLIIADDVNLEIGRMRMRPKGSSGGHKGLKSIIDELASEGFPRLRIGIGPKKDRDLTGHVLAPFKRGERGMLYDAIENGCLCAEAWIGEGIESAMSRFNQASPYNCKQW